MSIKHLFLSAALMTGALSTASPAVAGPDEYIGQFILVGFNFCPRGTAKADGQLLPISSNSALFSLFGTYYGGDGRTTFGLPDLRGRTVLSAGSGPGLSPRKIGQKGGVESSTGYNFSVKEGEGGKAQRHVEEGDHNMQPFNVLQYCVVTECIYPSRN